MFIEMVRESEDKLQSHFWRFNVFTKYSGIEIEVWSYTDRTRRTTRCKWVNKEIFSQMDKRHNTLSAPDVYLPSDVKEELKEKLISMIRNTPIIIERVK